MNLRKSYIEVSGGKPAAVGNLTDEFSVNRTRAGEWLNGKRPIPANVQRFMLECCIEWAILQEGGIPPNDENIGDLVARLTA